MAEAHKDTEYTEYPKVNTFTSASARRLSEERLSFPEMLPEEIAQYFGTDLDNGLTVKQVKRIRSSFGGNVTSEAVPVGFYASIKRQLKNLVTVFLFFAILVFYVFRGDPMLLAADGIILLLVVANAVMEYCAGRVFEKVRSMTAPKASVIRGGNTYTVDSRSLVPGDIIRLSPDDVVPADARLIVSRNLTVLETPVSGKKNAAVKDAKFRAQTGEIAIYENMVYAGTVVTGGSATAVVCVTGANVMRNKKPGGKKKVSLLPSYLKTVQKCTGIVAVTAIAAEMILLAAGLFRGVPLTDAFIAALAVGGASLCDTAFALSTAATGFGIRRAMKSGSLFRNLDAFGKISDTDTVMCGKEAAFPPKAIELESIYDCEEMLEYTRGNKPKVLDIVRCLLLCSSVREKPAESTAKKKKGERRQYVGNAYTLALLKASEEAGYTLEKASEGFTGLTAEYESGGEMSRLLGVWNDKLCVILRGSPESVLARSAGYRKNGRNYRLDDKSRAKILETVRETAKTSIPVAVALGYTTATTLHDATVEKKLIFLGFACFRTSTEISTASAVFKCAQAGIETTVFSDDRYYTALNLAGNAGVISGEEQICTAEMLRTTEEGLFIADNEKYRLFLDLNDSEELYILRLRRQNKHKVAAAVTRVEQSALIKEADSSFAYARSGGDALLNACDVQLTVGSFDSIVAAIIQAKLITRRLADICQYIFCGFMTMFFWMLYSVIVFGEIPFRVQDAIIFGTLINTVFALSAAFSPESRKTLSEHKREVSPMSMTKGILISAMYSAFGAALCLITGHITAGNVTERLCASLVTYLLVVYLFSLMAGKTRSVFTNRFYRNYNTVTVLVAGLSIAAALAYIPSLAAFFGYDTISPTSLAVAASIAFVYFLIIQLVMLVIGSKKPSDGGVNRYAKKTKEIETDEIKTDEIETEEVEAEVTETEETETEEIQL